MKTNSAEIIKSMRKEMGLSQEEMAEQLFISVRQLARIESGEAGLDVWQFITILELLGSPTEDFWLLYLDSSEYASYRDYKRLKRQLGNDDWSEAREIIADIEKKPLVKQPIVKQFIAYVKAIIGATEPSAKMLADLLEAMHMSRPGFDENKISEYRMSYNEINIALNIAMYYAALKEHNRAILIVQSMINNRENAKVSEDDKAIIFPPMYLTLSHILRNAERYREASRACVNALDICREYNNLKRVPEMLYSIGDCYYKLEEEEHVYKTHLVRAYHVAYGIGRNDAAVKIKKDALEHYGVTIP